MTVNGKVLLENKYIVVDDNQYRLTIEQEYRRKIGRVAYVAYLSDVNSQYTTSAVFVSIKDLENELRKWIIKADGFNNPEARVFETIRRWDGVINT